MPEAETLRVGPESQDKDESMADVKERLRVDVSIAEIRRDIANINKQLENGVSLNLTRIWDKLNELMPLVQDNAYWVGKWKKAIFWIAISAVGGGMVATAFYFLRTVSR